MSGVVQAESAPEDERLARLEKQFEIIRGLLQKGFPFLRFPVPLEQQFARQHQLTAVRNIRYSAGFVAVFYLSVGLISFLCLDRHQYPHWFPGFIAEGLALAGVVVCSSWAGGRFAHHYQFYTAICASLALVAITITTFSLEDPATRQYSSYGVLFVLMVVYGIAFLSLRTAMVAGWNACAVSLLLAWWIDLKVDWLQFGQYYLSASAMGMLLSYLLEHHERTTFLQAQLLGLEKLQLDCISQQMERMSQEDPLTGLANRRHFNQVFHSEWDRCRRSGAPVSVLFVDVDHFKRFNDHYGHLDGDRCLVRVASVLKDCVRRAGDMAVRYGGEEFVLLLPNTSPEGALHLARELLQAVDSLAIPHEASSTRSTVTVSIGVGSIVPVGEKRPAELLAVADQALYQAKQRGRHQVAVAAEAPVLDDLVV